MSPSSHARSAPTGRNALQARVRSHSRLGSFRVSPRRARRHLRGRSEREWQTTNGMRGYSVCCSSSRSSRRSARSRSSSPFSTIRSGTSPVAGRTARSTWAPSWSSSRSSRTSERPSSSTRSRGVRTRLSPSATSPLESSNASSSRPGSSSCSASWACGTTLPTRTTLPSRWPRSRTGRSCSAPGSSSPLGTG